MPKNCKPNRSLKLAEPWSHEELQRRRSLKLEKLKRKHMSDDGDDKDENKDIPFSLKRQMLLAHDTEEKKEKDKLRLHISKLNRQIEELRNRLTNWDDKEEEERLQKEKEEEQKRLKVEEDKEEIMLYGRRRIKKKRPGPETWKLRGAARPAWEVYDFDTRYVCPHMKEHEEAKEKVKRIQNILLLYRGKMDQGPKPHCYNFIMYLCQLGHLYYEEGKYSKARRAWIECLDLEGEVVMTNARYRLMRMYMNLGRNQSANRLCTDLSTTKSAWIQYSTLLLSYQNFISNDKSSKSSQELGTAFQAAISSNAYCIFYLSFQDVFQDVMEYTEDIEDAEEGSLLEAIEYCNSEQIGLWNKCGGVEWLTLKLGGVWRDLDWEGCLKEEENVGGGENNDEGDDDDDGEDSEEEDLDVSMYAGMFRTGMEMLIESGQLK